MLACVNDLHIPWLEMSDGAVPFGRRYAALKLAFIPRQQASASAERLVEETVHVVEWLVEEDVGHFVEM